ncbi:neuronal acetylcholine receptor subunit alpha-10-like [Ylistrum balloti]|uniref:neuronal acetylcholine receptor subunit alpha-10-like n=1 Tax=Ylistrum balloti TaxID=509963 RepID=UPI002905D46A|nr:neuronal acetylcholine receptor subunit alpha-10-like [Ylistrum balloti]
MSFFMYDKRMEYKVMYLKLIQPCASSVAEKANVSALMTHLFTNYHNEVKPVCDINRPVEVRIGMALRQIIELNEPKQLLQINAWMRWNWDDCNLVWNATEFDSIAHLIVPVKKLWIPDITLYDNAGSIVEGVKDYRLTISSSGSIAYNFPTVITSLCQVDVTYFPFDTQTCALTFGSWAYHGLQLNVTNSTVSGDLTSFVNNVEWDVKAVNIIRHVIYYGCCPEPYPDVTFYLVLDRKPLFYLLNLMFPCMLITSVACLGFLLPPDSGEKVSLEITVLLSLAVFLLVVSETLPPSSETFPYIGVYFLCAMLLVSVSCLMTVVVLNLHYKGNHGKEVPKIIRNIFFGVLGKLVLVKTPQKSTATVAPSPPTPKIIEVQAFDFEMKNNSLDNGKQNNKTIDETNRYENSKNVKSSESDSHLNATELINILRKQLESLSKIERFMRDHNKWEENIAEWQLLGQIVDRIFLFIFIIISFITTVTIFIQTSTN